VSIEGLVGEDTGAGKIALRVRLIWQQVDNTSSIGALIQMGITQPKFRCAIVETRSLGNATAKVESTSNILGLRHHFSPTHSYLGPFQVLAIVEQTIYYLHSFAVR
jgi:hypothetical protein